jgi:hypothetical protein
MSFQVNDNRAITTSFAKRPVIDTDHPKAGVLVGSACGHLAYPFQKGIRTDDKTQLYGHTRAGFAAQGIAYKVKNVL